MKTSYVAVTLSALVALVITGCGGSSPNSPTEQGIPPTEQRIPTPVTPPSSLIQNAINTVLGGVTASFNGTRNGSKSQAGLVGRSFLIEPAYTSQCNASGTSCSVQFNESFNPPATACTNGGSSSVSGTLTGVIQGSSTSVSGTLNMSVRSTIANCSENGWVTSTNPSFVTSGSVFITNQHTRLNLTMSGGMVITNAPGTPNGSASCVTNGVLLQWDDITGNWANSGSIDCTPGGSFRFN